MPVEAMPAPMSTVLNRPGLWSEGNILFSLQRKANLTLPKQPGRSTHTVQFRVYQSQGEYSHYLQDNNNNQQTLKALNHQYCMFIFLTFNLYVLLKSFSVKLLHIRTSCYSFLCKLLFFFISFKITCHPSNINTERKQMSEYVITKLSQAAGF